MLDRLDFDHFRHPGFDAALDALFEGHRSHGTTGAGTGKLDVNGSVFVHFDEFDIAPVCLERGPYFRECLFNLFLHG